MKVSLRPWVCQSQEAITKALGSGLEGLRCASLGQAPKGRAPHRLLTSMFSTSFCLWVQIPPCYEDTVPGVQGPATVTSSQLITSPTSVPK